MAVSFVQTLHSLSDAHYFRGQNSSGNNLKDYVIIVTLKVSLYVYM